jgi:hypothetical protein
MNMPNHEEHCEESRRRYGKPFSELHRWMDEPSLMLGTDHRMYRHNPYKTPLEARRIFGENADHACLDHIRLDELGDTKPPEEEGKKKTMKLKYKDLIDKVNKYHYKNEPIYFEAIADLEELRKDLTKLDDTKHLIGIVKPFLIKWGRMGRVVGKEGLDWRALGERLRSSEKDFDNLRKERFQTIDFEKDKISDSITTIYGKLDPLPYLGSPTTISKTLHLFNPEIFVMWDREIRKKYKKENRRIRDNSEGYLEFLKETQKLIRDVLNDLKKDSGKELDEIEKEIRNKYKNITLAKIIDELNYGAVHSF